MSVCDTILPEFDYECATTRKVLERLPDGKFDFRPHPKSGTLGWLASHLAEMPTWVPGTMKESEFDYGAAMASGNYKPTQHTTRDEVLTAFDKGVAEARQAMSEAKDEVFMQPWSLKNNGAEIFTMPKLMVIRGFIIKHTVHHRAQLGVYLRLNDIPLPGIYGPSADEA